LTFAQTSGISGWSICNMLQCWQCYISSTSACDPVILITDAASDSARKAPRNDPESPLLRWYWLSKWGGSHFGNFPVSADRFVMIFFDDSRGKRRPHFDWSMFAGNDALVQLRQLGLVTFYNVFVRRCVCVYHLNRCKTSIYWWGATAHLPMLPNEATEDVVDRFMDAWTCTFILFIYIYTYVYIVPPLGAYKPQLGGTYIFFRCCFIRSMSTVIIPLYIYIY
jgi:hypothetical protein